MKLLDTKTFATLNKTLAPHREGALINAVNARDLHECLCVGRDFSNWIRQRIEKYSFVENVDYITVAKTDGGEYSGFQPIDYFIAPDMAKQIAMVQNNDIGKQVRLYYIQLEKKQLEKEAQAKVRSDMRLDFHPMTDAVVVSREGKTTESHHFSNECDLINRVVLGATAKHNALTPCIYSKG
jgi:phage anti-repressor protein